MIESTGIERTSSFLLLSQSEKSPLIIGNIYYIRDRTNTCEHEVPHLTNCIKSLIIWDNGLIDNIIEIPVRGWSAQPSSVSFSSHASFSILG